MNFLDILSIWPTFPSISAPTSSLILQSLTLPMPTDLILLPKMNHPLFYTFDYAIVDLSRAFSTYSVLAYMSFTLTLSLDTRIALRRYILAHDPYPFTLLINDDYWFGYLLNPEPRDQYHPSDLVPFVFEVEYIGNDL